MSQPPGLLRDLMTAYWLSQALYVAAELGIADLLRDGPRPVAELARASGTIEARLRRVLRALSAAGVLEQIEPGRFGLTALGEQLRSDAPDSQRAQIVMFGQEWYWRAWGHLVDAMRDDVVPFERAHGVSFFDYLVAEPTAGAAFDAAMTGGTWLRAAVVDAYDFGPFGTVVDVGGGQGGLLAAILAANPHLRGVLFDRPALAAGAAERFATADLADRTEIVGGDFFERVPGGGDLYILSQILHDFDDGRCATILRNCRRAMSINGRLLVVERVIPDDAARPPRRAPHHPAVLADLNMLVLLGGQERTESDYRALLAEADLDLLGVTPLPLGGWCVAAACPRA